MSLQFPRPVRLLVSVRNAGEAEAAVEGGADIIDVKEPSRGPMGRADLEVVRGVIERVAGRRPISVALGELREDPPAREVPEGVSFAKIGLAGEEQTNWRYRLARKFAELPRSVQRVVVCYVNVSNRARPPRLDEVTEWAVKWRTGVMFDTYMKDRGGLLEPRRRARGLGAVQEFGDKLYLGNLLGTMKWVRSSRCTLGLAGSLQGETFLQALRLDPDIIGVRGAVCAGGSRRKRLEAERVRELAQLVAALNAALGAAGG